VCSLMFTGSWVVETLDRETTGELIPLAPYETVRTRALPARCASRCSLVLSPLGACGPCAHAAIPAAGGTQRRWGFERRPIARGSGAFAALVTLGVLRDCFAAMCRYHAPQRMAAVSDYQRRRIDSCLHRQDLGDHSRLGSGQLLSPASGAVMLIEQFVGMAPNLAAVASHRGRQCSASLRAVPRASCSWPVTGRAYVPDSCGVGRPRREVRQLCRGAGARYRSRDGVRLRDRPPHAHERASPSPILLVVKLSRASISRFTTWSSDGEHVARQGRPAGLAG